MKPPPDTRPYRYWYEFLKLHKGYKEYCTKGHGDYSNLYEDFGDVHRLPFPTWWSTHWHLFARPALRYLVEPVIADQNRLDDSLAEVKEALTPGSDKAVFVVNLLEKKRELVKDFAKKVRTTHGKRGRKPFDDTEAVRKQLHSRPDIESLKTTLRVYRLANRHLDWPLWKIALEAKLRDDDEAKLIPGDLDNPLKKDVLTATVSRILRRAEALIENCAHGEFPNSKFRRFRPRNTMRRSKRRAAGLGG